MPVTYGAWGTISVIHDGVIVDADSEACRLLRRRREAIVGADLRDILDGFDRDLENAWEAARTGDGYSGELRLRAGDGTVFLVDVEITGQGAAGGVGTRVAFRDAAERKEAEEVLRRSEERFRSLVQNTSDVITLLDADGTVRYASPAGEKILGFRSEESVGTNAFDFVHPDDKPSALGLFEEVLKKPGVHPPLEFRVPHKDGSWRYLEHVPNNLLDDPAVRGIVVTSRDVTERKEAEEALRRSEAEIFEVLESITDGFFALDREWRFTYVNSQAEVLFSRAREDLIGERIWEDPTFYPQYQSAVAEGKTVRFEGYYPPLEAWYSVRAYPSESGLSVYLQDITERKEAEEALRETEERYRMLVEQVPAVSYTIDATSHGSHDAPRHGAVTYMSPQIERILAYPPEPFVEDTRFWDSLIHPDDLARVTAEDVRTEKSGDQFEIEYRMRHQSGHWVWVRDDAALVQDETGRPLFWQGVFVDVSRRKRDEEEIRRLNEDLERRVEQRTVQLKAAVKEAEEAQKMLGLNMERFRSLVRHTSDIITILEADGTVRYVSPAVERVLGYKPKERVGKNTFELVHPQDREKVREVFIETLANKYGTATVEMRLLHKDGSWRYLESIGTDLRTDPSVGGVIVNSRDVTQRKRSEQRLQVQYAVARILERSAAFEDASSEILRAVCEAWGWDAGALWLRDRQADVLRCVRTWSDPSIDAGGFDEVTRRSVFSCGEGLPGRVWASGEAVWVSDIAEDKNSPWGPFATEAGLRAAFAFPIVVRGKVLGVAEFSSREIQQPDRALLETMENIGAQVGQFIERKHVEEELVQSEQRFRATFEQAAVGVAHVALEGRWLRVNEKLCEILGYPREELLQKTFQDITHPEDLDADVEQAGRLSAGEIDTYSKEKRYVRKDGSIVWVELTMSLLRDPEGMPLYFISVVEDISERKRTEEARRQSEELYRTVVGQGAANIFLVDVETKRILEANAALYTSLGYGPEEMKGMSLYDVVAHDRASIDRNMERIRADGERMIGERKYRRKDGTIMDVEVNVRAIPYGGREIMCVVAHDITERKQAEDNFRHSLAVLLALYEAGQVLVSSLDLEEIGPRLLEIMRRVANLDAAVICLRDEHGELRVRYAVGPAEAWSSARETPEGRQAREAAMATGQPQPFRVGAHDRDAVPSDDLCGLCLPLRVLDRPIGVLESFGPSSLADRAAVEVLTSLASQAGSALENARLYGELAEREKRLENLVGKLIAAQEEERRRVAYEVHDGLAQSAVAAHQRLQTFAARHVPISDRGQEDLGRVLRLVRRTVGEARKVIAGLRPTVLDDFGLAAALRQKVEELREDGWTVEYEEELGDERLPVALETALFRIALEALTNARKHAQTDRTRLELLRQKGTVTLRIQDWGKGFDPEDLDGGAGPGERMGLSGMRERAGMVGGDIQVRSRLGEGTSITVQVPLPGRGAGVPSRRERSSPEGGR